jgi:hypothetical protein
VNPVVVNERSGDRLIPLEINERVAWLHRLKDGQEIDADMRNILIGEASAYDLGVSDERQRATRIISGDRD